MRIVLTGATGMIGRQVAVRAIERGHQIIALSRSSDRAAGSLPEGTAVQEWPDPQQEPPPGAALAGSDAVIHLLGEPVAQRWTDSAKQEIRNSRVLSTRQVVSGLRSLPEQQRPRVLVSGSATGFYGPRGDEPVDEGAQPGDDFLAGVVVDWEHEAQAAGELGVRVVCARTGVVLAPEGGALEKMLPPFKIGVGGPVAGGGQYVPWIHLDDVVGALLHLVESERAHGPVNLTAPRPVTNGELSKSLGRVLHRPAVLPVPGAAVKLLYGEMASVVTTGQRAVPAELEKLGYSYAHPELEPALQDVLGRG